MRVSFRILLSLFITVLLIPAALYAQEGEGSTPEKEKSSWYIGFGLGSGNGNWNVKDYGNVTFDEWSEGGSNKQRLSVDFGIGAILTPQVNLGFNLNLISNQLDYMDTHYNAQINNYMLMLTVFPMTEGLMLRAGAGLSAFVIMGGNDTMSEKGAGGLVGIGYSFPLCSSFNIGINADYSYQVYDSELKNSQFWSVYVSLYWF